MKCQTDAYLFLFIKSCNAATVVTDSESATESVNFSGVHPNLNPRIFVAVSDGFGSSVCESVFTYQEAAFKQRCVTVSGRVGD